ncbi:MAG: prepilin-type N-terminal cleavage/methylation domain-containing protein [Aliarcobacter sp.]|nr:prepilin-type N-terminal cleavage/methylation domain-containing protein [Aliarcobacter sp.]
MKSAFSLLELIFAIVILGIVASFAIPKYLDTKDSALVSTIKRDISTATSSLQSYYLLNQKIDKISDAISVNDTNWNVTDTKIADKNSCLSLEIKTSDDSVKTIELTVDTTKTTTICKKIQDSGLITTSYELY